MTQNEALDVIVVGAGPAGLWAARKIQQSSPDLSIMVLESGDRSLGRVLSGLHLVDSSLLDSYPIQSAKSYSPLKVRWERNWVDPMDVEWKSKDWIASIPQWTLHMRGTWSLFKNFDDPSVEVPIKWHCPVSEIVKADHSSNDLWKLITPCGEFFARHVYWAAGMTAFQNAYGKIPSQSLLVANPRFNEDAMEFRGGIAVEFEIESIDQLQEDFPKDHLVGIPVRHEGKLYLSFMILEDLGPASKSKLLTLTHLPSEFISDPKAVASFQKSLRRSAKALLKEECHLGREKWVVSPSIFGHIMGHRSVFGEGIKGSLEFLGDETLSAQGRGNWDLVSALDSVAGVLLTSFEKKPVSVSSDALEEVIPRIVL